MQECFPSLFQSIARTIKLPPLKHTVLQGHKKLSQVDTCDSVKILLRRTAYEKK